MEAATRRLVLAFAVASAASIGGCARHNLHEIDSRLSLGMTPEQVQAACGRPNDVIAQNGRFLYEYDESLQSVSFLFVMFTDDRVSKWTLEAPNEERVNGRPVHRSRKP